MAGVRSTDDTKIEIYNHPNPEIKSFLTTVELSAPRVEIFKKTLDKNWEGSLNQLPLIATQIIKDIMAIPGMREIHITSSWDGIEKRVIEILTSAIRRKQMKLVQG
ncbi:MAG: hypothetical protein JRJ21_10635 [Deltaproteobacteria bacterium]|nr:hypothetical protein [Deltaproteobacteria bacterium]